MFLLWDTIMQLNILLGASWIESPIDSIFTNLKILGYVSVF